MSRAVAEPTVLDLFHASARARDALRVRVGAACFAVAALLEVIGLLFRGPLTSPARAPARFVQVSSSSTLHLSWELLLSAAMLQCFGWLAVYGWARASAEERWAFRGMIFAIASLIVLLPVWGAFGLTSHEAALAETAGQHGAVALVGATAEGPVARKFLVVSVLAGLVATGIWSRVFWRAGSSIRWIVPLMILHTISTSITAPLFPPWGFRLERLGAFAFLIVGTVVALHIWRDEGAASATVANRERSRGSG